MLSNYTYITSQLLSVSGSCIIFGTQSTQLQPAKKTILIVDDSALIVRRLIDMLNELDGLEWIKSSDNYIDALQLINTTEPDILLLDINLPDKSGIDILRVAKKTNPSTKIIMITNQANDYYRQLCLRLGAEYFIDKTKEFEQIAGIIAGMP